MAGRAHPRVDTMLSALSGAAENIQITELRESAVNSRLEQAKGLYIVDRYDNVRKLDLNAGEGVVESKEDLLEKLYILEEQGFRFLRELMPGEKSGHEEKGPEQTVPTGKERMGTGYQFVEFRASPARDRSDSRPVIPRISEQPGMYGVKKALQFLSARWRTSVENYDRSVRDRLSALEAEGEYNERLSKAVHELKNDRNSEKIFHVPALPDTTDTDVKLPPADLNKAITENRTSVRHPVRSSPSAESALSREIPHTARKRGRDFPARLPGQHVEESPSQEPERGPMPG